MIPYVVQALKVVAFDKEDHVDLSTDRLAFFHLGNSRDDRSDPFTDWPVEIKKKIC